MPWKSHKKMINEAAKAYPNFKAVATTLREVKTATVNDWSAICWADGEIYKAEDCGPPSILYAISVPWRLRRP